MSKRIFHSGFGMVFVLVFAAILLLGSGAYIVFTGDNEDSGVKDEAAEKDDFMTPEDSTNAEPIEQMGETSVQAPFTGTLLAGSKTSLLDFTKSDYDTALASKKVIVLYFYANWCPICKAEFPKAQSAFDELDNSDVVGFRVNFNDNETDQHEKDLAREFGVAYQHTKVILQNGERVLKSPESWEKNRYISEINSFVTN